MMSRETGACRFLFGEGVRWASSSPKAPPSATAFSHRCLPLNRSNARRYGSSTALSWGTKPVVYLLPSEPQLPRRAWQPSDFTLSSSDARQSLQAHQESSPVTRFLKRVIFSPNWALAPQARPQERRPSQVVEWS